MSPECIELGNRLENQAPWHSSQCLEVHPAPESSPELGFTMVEWIFCCIVRFCFNPRHMIIFVSLYNSRLNTNISHSPR